MRTTVLLTLLGIILLGPPALLGQEPEVLAARKLYLLNCAVCHGDNGRGNGRAARFVFPKPRDFSSGKMRLVSTVNHVAGAKDIRKAIELGFPGTSMQSWKELGDERIQQLVDEVIRLRNQGVRKRLQEQLRQEEGDASTEEIEIDAIVQGLTIPGNTWQAPRLDLFVNASIQRGEQVYLKQSCHSCHGREGAGSWKMDLVDDKGRPSWATDLRFDALKGGEDAVSLARRIVLGMPGSSMPSSRKLSDQELVDLVRFCQSLSRPSKYQLTNHQRAQRAVGFRRPPEPKKSP